MPTTGRIFSIWSRSCGSAASFCSSAAALGLTQVAEQVGDDLVVWRPGHRRSSSIIARSDRNPLIMRALTVPSGIPVASAICTWVWSS